MKQFKWRKLAAVLLVVCLSVGMVTPASAAGLFSSGRSSGLLGSLTDRWNNLWNSIFGGAQEKEPAEDAGNTETETGDLTLVEDETTVTEGTDLRASTYSLQLMNTRATTTLKYFPVTLYDYNTETINNATHQVEVDARLGSQWNGIYFSAGSPEAESYTYTTSGVTYSQEQDGDISWRSLAPDNTDQKSTGYYVRLTSDGQYYPAYVTRTSSGSGWGKEYYFKLEYQKNNHFYTVSTGSSRNDCPEPSGNAGVETVTITGYWSSNTYVALYKPSTDGSKTTGTLDYAAWNFWNKKTDTNDYGQYTYSGLVESTLDAYKNIQFTKPDGGIFNSDNTVKTIYTNVEMPFVYDSATKYYTFDASQDGVYFKKNSTQGSTTARSGGRLYFDNTPQGVGGASFGDGSKTVWAPFDSTTDLTGRHSTVDMNYHFGMAATIPFTMTANGRIDPNDNDSAPIEFTFSGDDDVWVFVDGQLVLDLGGIHNRLDATINFADNTWTLSESNSVEVAVDDYNGAAISGKLFNDGSTTGKLGQSLTTFAAKESHELTIFYLERGEGSSNCKIRFNLPMKDTVSVTKQITQSVDANGTKYNLTDSELKQVNNVEFGFTLYEGSIPVANALFNVVNANGQVLDTRTTNSSGHFTLKNGQTARFIVDIPEQGQSYQVVEDWAENSAYTQPDYSYSGNAAKGFVIDGESYTQPNPSLPGTTGSATSRTITVKGSEEAEDSLNFVCTNYWKHVNNTTITAYDDKIVVDYGLPVVISPLENDVAQNGEKSLVSVSEGKFGEALIEGNTIRYTLDKQLTDVEVLTYTVKATGENGVDTDTKTAKIYIIPATTMYYEEVFSGLVTFSNGWRVEGTSKNAIQEPGVVGTIGDSPYGSDAAYKGYVGDSNGTSQYVDTTKSSASFSYSFTGTGTSFFARTSGTSAVLSIQVTDKNGTQIAYQNRNTKYVATDGTNVGTLYNIPVYTIENLDYGTYTVNVTVLKAVEVLKYGKDFYLDGIRVVSPLNPSSENGEVAVDAYSDDGEAGMVSATLRQKLLKDYTTDGEDGLVWTDGGFVVFTDSDGNVAFADEYQSNGPKEELYLNAGQSVTFSLANWDADSNKIYLGIKAPVGAQTITIGSQDLDITNSADCYYDITAGYGEITTVGGVKVVTFTIKAGDGLISLTNIKVTGDPDFAIITPGNVEVGDNVDVEA